MEIFTIEYLTTPTDFNFVQTVFSHGWSELKPFQFDLETKTLSFVLNDGGNDKAVAVQVSEEGERLLIRFPNWTTNRDEIVDVVKNILRFDVDLRQLYDAIGNNEELAWMNEKNAGRMLRSPTVFEDLLKTLCTTNCSWGLTKIMITNLTEKLGQSTGEGRFAFPTVDAFLGLKEEFFREEIRVGYRAPYFVELIEKIADGTIRPEEWRHSDLPTPELKKELKLIKGIGDYASENLLKLLGRYDGLALDSWLRGGFYKKHNKGKVCADKKIEKHYKRYGKWKGLVIWCDIAGDRIQ